MKPFDLEKAKAGAKVCLGDGTPARIIAFDAKGNYPIVTLVASGEIEKVVRFTTQGRRNANTGVDNSHIDLVMAPVTVQGWVNVYKEPYDLIEKPVGVFDNIYSGRYIYKSENLARCEGEKSPLYLKTIAFEWEK